MTKKFSIVFPHFPKTGGTTMLYHFRKAYGDERILLVGPHGRTNRFFEGKPQFEELSPDEIRDYAVLQGHGVNEGTSAIANATGLDTKLMIILRNPVGLSRSRFNHRSKHVARNGRTLTTKEFMSEGSNDPMCKMLINNFSSFIKDSTTSLSEQAKQILSKFDYVFTTEKMDEQCKKPMAFLGLPLELERRRVAEAKLELEATDDELRAFHAHDLILFEGINQIVESDGASYNALGFDPKGKENALALATDVNKDPVNAAYLQLCNGICRELKAEAALEKLNANRTSVALKDLDGFEMLLKKRWSAIKDGLRPIQSKQSQKHLAKLKKEMAAKH